MPNSIMPDEWFESFHGDCTLTVLVERCVPTWHQNQPQEVYCEEE